MGKIHGWLLLALTCSAFCKAQFFYDGYEIEGTDECFCGDRMKKTTPLPLEINLTWAKKDDPDRTSAANGARTRYELGE